MAGNLSMHTPEQRVQRNAYDVDAWNLLLRENQKKHIDQARDFYERLATQFPTAGRFWKAYVEHELRSKNYENVEKLFTRCLVKVLNIDLWKCYLHYVRETKGTLPSFREKMAQAYDFALDKVGMDMNSFQIFADYAAFLRQVPASGSYQEYQKIAAVRKIYHRGVHTPIFNVDQLWSEYCNYEKSINAHLAEKLIAEKNRDYQTARRVVKQLEAMTRGLNRQAVSVPPRGTAMELKQNSIWKKYIAWEKQNPLQTEDLSLFSKRVAYAYEQALLCLGYHPDVWYEAGLFLQESAKKLGERGDAKLSQKFADDVAVLYERACTSTLHDCALLHCAYADYEEGRMKHDKCATIYQRFIDQSDIDPTLTYVQYMKFSRRTEGIKAARAVFKRAREDQRSSYHVYIAAALMEYSCSKDADVATRVFDLGLKKYGHEPDYVLACIDFRTHLNDDNNTRVLFERVLTSGNLAADKSLPIWDKYLEFESRVGDLTSVLKVDARRCETATKELGTQPTLLLVDRYRMMDLMPCSTDTLTMLGYAPSTSSDTQSTASHATVSDPLGIRTQTGETSQPNVGATTTTTTTAPRPDTSQMIPFKPKIVLSSEHPIPGGVFAPPPAVAHLMTLLPPPWCFNVPKPGDHSGMENGRINDIKKELYQMLATTPDPMQVLRGGSTLATSDTRKRSRNPDSDEESSEVSGPGLGPSAAMDVYRMRQQMKRTK